MQLPIPPPAAGETPQPSRGNVPLAAGCLKLLARRRGLEDSFRIEILPAVLANTLGDQGLVGEILRRRPLLVGFTCYLWNIERTVWIAGRLKEARPAIGILLGGPEITPDNRWVLDAPAVDLAVFGEGEATFVDLLSALAGLAGDGSRFPTDRFPPVAGLWRRGGPLPQQRPPLGSLDAVSSPYLEGILDAAQDKTLLLETARGCRYRCRYCYYPKNYRRVYSLSPGQVSACLAHAAERGVTEVVLLDPTLNQRPDFLPLLGLLARGNPRRQWTYSAELRAEGIGAEAARAMRKANFQEVEVGLQSIDPETQRLMGRRLDLPAFERGARALLDEGISVRVDLILGLPGDTPDSVRRGIEYLDRVRPLSELQVFNLSILPGTAFRRQARRLGLEYQPRPPYYVLRTPTLDVAQMYRLMEEAQQAFGVEFDAFPPPRLEAVQQLLPSGHRPKVGRGRGTQRVPGDEGWSSGPAIAGAVVELDGLPAADALGPGDRRALAFTLWLRSADFAARAGAAGALVARVLADNPHTTLQVVLEPCGDPRRITRDLVEGLLAECYRTTSYLDWYYSLHPGGLLGAKRMVVVAPWAQRPRLGMSWIDEIGEAAAVVWTGSDGPAAALREWEYLAASPEQGWATQCATASQKQCIL
ncbi:MAG: radical SAM protein [Thermoguttaceae bacterium]